jgi:DNA-binding response OmpR family regulator
MRMRVAIVTALADLDRISTDLVAGGHHCHSFGTTALLSARLANDTFDLLILDSDAADRDGIDLLSWMGSNLDVPIPTLFLAQRNKDEDIVTGLEAGADDYIVKPVAHAVLLARIKALMRRIMPREASIASETYGAFTLQPARRMIFVEGQAITLTAKEFDLAVTLFRNMRKPLSRTYLIETVWGSIPNFPSRTLDVHISRIRTKIGLRPDRGFRLVHVYNYGYRLDVIETPAE